MALWLWTDPRTSSRPSQILEQHFGSLLDPEDLNAPMIPQLRQLMRYPLEYFRPWRSLASRQDSGSTVSFGEDKFQASLDVQQFKPEEITVKASGNTVTIEGKHEEKQDQHGYISRHFVRKYVLPKGHDMAKVESKLSSDGVLTITAPKVDSGEEQKVVPIVQTGQPSKPVEKVKDQNEMKEDKNEKKEDKIEKKEDKHEKKEEKKDKVNLNLKNKLSL